MLWGAMKKWLILLLSALVAGFVVLVCIHADCSVREVVVPIDVPGTQK